MRVGRRKRAVVGCGKRSVEQHALPNRPLKPIETNDSNPQGVAHQELVRALRLEAAKEGSKARQEFELAARELAAKYDKKMKMLRDDLELRRKHELHEVGGCEVWLREVQREVGGIEPAPISSYQPAATQAHKQCTPPRPRRWRSARTPTSTS
jgi:hypothetical protein